MISDLEEYCRLFYASHYIPISLYDKERQLVCCSAYDLFLRIQPLADASADSPDIISLPDRGQYGIIRIKESEKYLLIGPVFSDGITKEMVFSISRANLIPGSEIETLQSFLLSIPAYTYNQFLYLIAYLHFSLNGETFNIDNYIQDKSSDYQNRLSGSHTENTYLANENRQFHNTYQFENILLSYVSRGETEKLKAFLSKSASSFSPIKGRVADTPLRQAKNIFLGAVALVGKVGAVKGGMNVEEVYRLIDLYSQECEKALSTDMIDMLHYNMLIDFTERVSQCQVPDFVSPEIFSCMQFIQNHTNCPIVIDDVAEYIKKSRSYLTRKFRQECGMSVTDFITQSKIRDAQRLLRFTDRSLADISNYLCYSSQAYFQSVFKRQTGTTPNEYRKSRQNF